MDICVEQITDYRKRSLRIWSYLTQTETNKDYNLEQWESIVVSMASLSEKFPLTTVVRLYKPLQISCILELYTIDTSETKAMKGHTT